MPSSNLAIAPQVLAWAWERSVELDRPITVLDVGVGNGKYGLLAREYLGDRLARIVGLEAERRYLARFPWLHMLYDDLLPFGVETLPETYFAGFDLVLMVDVLEHLDVADGARLLGMIGPPVIVCTPRNYFENPEAVEYPTESHRSHWSVDALVDVRCIDRHAVDALEDGAVLVRMAPLS